MNDNSTVKFSEIKSFVENNPYASAQDLLNKIINNDDTIAKAELDRLRQCKEWYGALTGRYFIVKFNDASSSIIKIDKDMSNTAQCEQPVFDIIYDNERLHVSKSIRRINRLWFNNPYEIYNGYGSTNKVTEVDKDYFEKVDNMYNNIKEIFKATLIDENIK